MRIGRAESEIEVAQFNGVWTTVWMESGYELEVSEYVLDRNIVYCEQGFVIGVAEVKQYFSDKRSKINQFAPFNKHPLIQHIPHLVGECDKVAVLKAYRGKGKYIHGLLSSICNSAHHYQFKYIVSLLEPMFMNALIKYYKVPMEEVADPFFYKGDYVVPVVMDVGYINAHPTEFNWYMKSY